MASTDIFKRIIALEAKSRKLKTAAMEIDSVAQKALDELAKMGRARFKKGQIFKKNTEKVWAKLLSVDSLTIGRCALLVPGTSRAPYVLACKRCTVKGVVPGISKWIFIDGKDVGNTWTLVDKG